MPPNPLLLVPVKTPCIGVCSTSIGDTVCRGCKRFMHEIIGWNGFSNDQKRLVDRRLEQFLTQIMQARFDITDEILLAEMIRLQQVRVSSHRNLWCQLFELLRAGGSQIERPELYGFVVLPKYRHINLVQLGQDTDSEFWTLSSAHFERYFRRPSSMFQGSVNAIPDSSE
jgi:predicted Fe-S protein YdhL (DUF1289 family)